MHSNKSGASLYCGGWSRDAVTEGLAVIDLTGSKEPAGGNPFRALNSSASDVFGSIIDLNRHERAQPWLSFAVKDFGTPQVNEQTWELLSNIILELLTKGTSVLIACNGGHGRTGTVAAIICHMLNPDIGDPVDYLRSVYCKDAVENHDQHAYVNRVLGLPEPDPKTYYKHGYVTYNYSYNSVGGNDDMATSAQSGADNGLKSGGSNDSVFRSLSNLPGYAEMNLAMDELGVDHQEVPYGMNWTVEVAVQHEQSLEYYEVIKYDGKDRAVRVVSVSGGYERWIPIENLATTADMDTLYENRLLAKNGR